jgi:hypothetical protein
MVPGRKKQNSRGNTTNDIMAPVTKRIKKGIKNITGGEDKLRGRDPPDDFINPFPNRAKKGVENITQGKKSGSPNRSTMIAKEGDSNGSKGTKSAKTARHHRIMG